MSCNQSVNSQGDVVASSITVEIPASPSSKSQQLRPPSPSTDSLVGMMVTPQNPFDTIIDIPSVPSLSQSGSGTDSLLQGTPGQNVTHSIVGNEIIQSPLVANLAEKSASPDRSSLSHLHTPLHPSSPISLHNEMVASLTVQSCEKSISAGSVNASTPILSQQLTYVSHGNVLDQSLEYRATSSPQSQDRFFTPGRMNTSSTSQQYQPNFDDDEKTEPSSAANTFDQTQPPRQIGTAQGLTQQSESVTESIVRFIQDARRRIGSKDYRKDSDGENLLDGALISGYLQKYGRNGKWQTRWFETDGECLSYYKSGKRTKLLATLDLEKVGTIQIDPEDPREMSFTIQVLGRLYHLRAESRGTCKDWVITLNRVKEARLQQGNVKLLNRTVDFFRDPDGDATPRVVVVANRQRTRAVDEDEQWDQLYKAPEDPTDPIYMEQKRLSALGTAAAARWSKRHSTLRRLGSKLAQWARSVKKYGCQNVDTENIALDHHVHPPGHDDQSRLPTKSVVTTYSNDYSRKSSVTDMQPTNPTNDVLASTGVPKPFQPSRSLSTASEEYRTIS